MASVGAPYKVKSALGVPGNAKICPAFSKKHTEPYQSKLSKITLSLQVSGKFSIVYLCNASFTSCTKTFWNSCMFLYLFIFLLVIPFPSMNIDETMLFKNHIFSYLLSYTLLPSVYVEASGLTCHILVPTESCIATPSLNHFGLLPATETPYAFK